MNIRGELFSQPTKLLAVTEALHGDLYRPPAVVHCDAVLLPRQGEERALEENLPEGFMYYHGLTNAAARAGLSFDGRKVLRDIVCLLDRDEVVRAVGKGQYTDEPGFVVLTARRLVFVPQGAAVSVAVMDVPIESIEAISLGKRISGETLRVALPGTVTEISHLGHAEGQGIATSSEKPRTNEHAPLLIPPRTPGSRMTNKANQVRGGTASASWTGEALCPDQSRRPDSPDQGNRKVSANRCGAWKASDLQLPVTSGKAIRVERQARRQG